jgi:hypothetical protein
MQGLTDRRVDPDLGCHNNRMSSSEPASPLARRSSANPAGRGIEADVFLEAGVDDPDADLAAQRQRERLTETIFRTPKAGEHIDAEPLEEEL